MLVTGASGMLGAALTEHFQDVCEVYATGASDFTGNRARRYRTFDLASADYAPLLDWARPEIVLHSGALTNVNTCEEAPEKAMAVNAGSTARLLESGSRVLFISSDAVFADGIPMATEADTAAPPTVYGRTKAASEGFITAAGNGHCALRTTIVGVNRNPAKQSFAEWIVRSLRAGQEISLFHDAVFTPLSIWALARELEWLKAHPSVGGILHVSGSEPVSKYDFGLSLCRELGLDEGKIKRASLEDFPARAGRSKDQTLDSSRYEKMSGRRLPGTMETVRELALKFREE